MYDFAILGGAFNPIHNGHLYIAEECLRLGVATRVIFMPNGIHPLKSTAKLLPYAERYELVELAIKSNSNFSISDLDSPKYGINYTYDLMQRLSKHYSFEQFTFLIGYDNALNFSHWHQPEWLLDNVHFTVLSRNSDLADKSVKIDSRFNIVEIEPYEISSTQVRDLLERDEPLNDLVPTEIRELLTSYWKNLKLTSHQ